MASASEDKQLRGQSFRLSTASPAILKGRTRSWFPAGAIVVVVRDPEYVLVTVVTFIARFGEMASTIGGRFG